MISFDWRSELPLSLGMVVGTPGAARALAQANISPMPYLIRHSMGDWGTIDPEDAKLNEQAVLDGSRILSAYDLPTGVRIWIITEADRSVTTILLPSEY